MKILSHRGMWTNHNEKNSIEAFRKAFSFGFGVETDIRDFNKELVISHDMPTSESLLFSTFLEIYLEYDKGLTLALNIKSDGLQSLILQMLKNYDVENYFVFDMSIPDTLLYRQKSIKFLSRVSEIEPIDSLIEGASGIWLDAFNSEWYSLDLIETLLAKNLEVCIVSAELHGRAYNQLWSKILSFSNNQKFSLCTDYPEQARQFFNSDI
jgi:hypothetical protein